MELRERLRVLEKERDEALSKSQKAAPQHNDREMLLDVREYSLENSKKYPLIFATNATSLIVEEMKKQASKSGKTPSMDVLFDTIESKIEEYELRKAERLKGTPLYDKLYGNMQGKPEVQPEEKPKSEEKPKKRVIPKDTGRPTKDTSVQTEVPNKVISADEAHQLAYEAYLAHRRNTIVKS